MLGVLLDFPHVAVRLLRSYGTSRLNLQIRARHTPHNVHPRFIVWYPGPG